jgi:S-DNA-T family DNA segregation ATPase FtsK/SpoIIIE
MRVVHRSERGERVVEIDIDDPSRPIAALCAALGLAAQSTERIGLAIDGRSFDPDTPLAETNVCEGSIVDSTPTASTAPSTTIQNPTPSARALAIVGGVRAGGSVPVEGGLCVGRSITTDVSLNDAALSPRHFSVTAGGASLIDHGTRNGTSIEGHPVTAPAELSADQMIRAGTTRLMVRDIEADTPVAVASGLGARGGSIPFNRPPRCEPPAEMVTLWAPGLRPKAPATEPISVAGIVLPILAGGVMALVFSPFMAIFAALGPVLTIGTWFERRRRTRREFRAAERVFLAEMDDLRDVLPSARRAEVWRRRTLHPDPAEVVRRAAGPSVRVWERRPGHADSFSVAIGAADEPFRPPLHASQSADVAVEVGRVLADLPLLPDVPVPLDLGPGKTVGLVGDRGACLAIARSLVVQMATHHGPADLAVAVGADEPRRWRWCEWLPHTADHASGLRGVTVVATNDSRAAESIRAMQGERLLLTVLDGDDPFQGRTTVGRILAAADRVATIVLVADEHRLPATCDRVVRADAFGRVTLVDPRQASPGRSALGWGVSVATAQHAARRLARLDDPELPVAGAGVPSTAPLLSLLDIQGDNADEVEARWRATDGTADLASPIGLDADGVVSLDLVREGPHVLVGGTTGSGKSELLRSLVAGLASSADPDHVAMVLVDYKGGAAFDCCADLPHVAGLVTDLDETLAARALRCLEAELHHRELRLRELGAEDLSAFRRLAAGRDDIDPLPRLVVVVDEFASLASDLPEFLNALVGIAQRGRSLGVHMILATQRPAGVVTDDIRANTSCRIALRVTDRGDSSDVIGSPDAAAIPRHRPGRAIARFGPGELVPFQSALATGYSDGRAGVSLVLPTASKLNVDRDTDLQRLVRSVGAAHRARGGGLPRSPWPPALPTVATQAAHDAAAGEWLLVDEPDRQQQRTDGWLPADGHLCVVGGPGSGTTTTLATAALAASSVDQERHLHVIDLDAGGLAPLANLPTTGTYCGPSDVVRRGRLLRWLDDEVGRRRVDPTAVAPEMLVVIDDFGGLARAHDPVKEAAVHERLGRVWADGPAVGIKMAVSLRRSADLPPALAATVGEVILHRTSDQADALRFGLVGSTAGFVAGRVMRSRDGATAQVLLPATGDDFLRGAVAGWCDVDPAFEPHQVGELVAEIPWSTANSAFHLDSEGCSFVIGVRDRDLEPAMVRLHAGEHFLVLGPARSGRTNTIAAIARSAGRHAIVVGHGPLVQRTGIEPTDAAGLAAVIATQKGGAIVLIDDCLEIDDPLGALAALVSAPPAGVHLVVAARPDRYRSAYGHWASDIKSSRAGILLRPEPLDGDLLGQQLPVRLGLPAVPGRGIVIADTSMEIVQVFQTGASNRRDP